MNEQLEEILLKNAFELNTNIDFYSLEDFGCSSYIELFKTLQEEGYLKLTDKYWLKQGFDLEQIETTSFEIENDCYLQVNVSIFDEDEVDILSVIENAYNDFIYLVKDLKKEGFLRF